MAMIIFTVLNGLGVVFLLYVLVQFWKDGHRSKNSAARQYAVECSYEDRPEVVVITQLISRRAQARLSVVSLQGRERTLKGKQVHRDSVDGIIEMPTKGYSTR